MNQLLSRIILFTGLLILPVTVLWAQNADQETRALIAELGLDESETPLRDQPGWNKPDKIYIDISGYTPDSDEQKM
jgi:hypothetical protein